MGLTLRWPIDWAAFRQRIQPVGADGSNGLMGAYLLVGRCLDNAGVQPVRHRADRLGNISEWNSAAVPRRILHNSKTRDINFNSIPFTVESIQKLFPKMHQIIHTHTHTHTHIQIMSKRIKNPNILPSFFCFNIWFVSHKRFVSSVWLVWFERMRGDGWFFSSSKMWIIGWVT